MPRGICKLCLEEKDLRRSHLLGKALYDLSREDGDDPVVMTPGYSTPSQRQVWAHLLCDDCEQRFSTYGEEPVMKLVQREKDFRLLDLMNVAMSWRNNLNVTTYSGLDMGINTEELAYYALSVVWRSGVQKWTTSNREATGISLGAHGEPIRQYLHGEAGFPAGVVVMVTVWTDPGSRLHTIAPSLKKDSVYPTYSLLARGIWFDTIVGENLPQGAKDLCCVNSVKKVLFLNNCEDRILQAAERIHKTAKVSEKLKQSPV